MPVESVKKPVFLLGAGFNADAKAEAGPIYGQSIYIGKHEIQCGYPLVAELAKLCFNLDSVPAAQSIEDLFQKALSDRDFNPISTLTETLMRADYYLVSRLLPSPTGRGNCYSEFFECFGGCHFLTFNYDSLPEVFLLRQELWCPNDGYGLPVAARKSLFEDNRIERSTSFVLHLHGSLCVYTSTFMFEKSPGSHIAWYKEREQPKFVFDPYNIAHLFPNFEGMPRGIGWDRLEDRVVAPVPNKTEGLKKEFITEAYVRAVELLRASTGPLVAIGYSFNLHDRPSYDPLLKALESGSGSLLLVSPDASAVCARIAADYPQLSFEPVSHTLKSWVDAGFPGVSSKVSRFTNVRSSSSGTQASSSQRGS